MVHVVIDRYFSLFLKGLNIFLDLMLSLIVPLIMHLAICTAAVHENHAFGYICTANKVCRTRQMLGLKKKEKKERKRKEKRRKKNVFPSQAKKKSGFSKFQILCPQSTHWYIITQMFYPQNNIKCSCIVLFFFFPDKIHFFFFIGQGRWMGSLRCYGHGTVSARTRVSGTFDVCIKFTWRYKIILHLVYVGSLTRVRVICKAPPTVRRTNSKMNISCKAAVYRATSFEDMKFSYKLATLNMCSRGTIRHFPMSLWGCWPPISSPESKTLIPSVFNCN